MCGSKNMTEKEALQVELDFIKTMIVNIIFGVLIGVAIYNLETQGSKLKAVLIIILCFSFVLICFRLYMIYLLKKLKNLT